VPPIEAVIFDYGGVISQSPFRRMAEYEQALGLEPGTLSELFGYGPMVPEPLDGEPYTNHWHLLEVGAIDLPTYATWVTERTAAVFGDRIDLAARMGNGLGSMAIHWMVVHRVRELREAGYRLAICTNNIAAYRDTWQLQFPVEWFDVVVDSSEVGVRKPEPAIYQLTCDLLGVAPDRCAFVDDLPANVAAAEALGMAGVLVGDDPWVALAELDEVLTARGPIAGARTSAGS
jgi:putative hydrolase of the HAD superfamily